MTRVNEAATALSGSVPPRAKLPGISALARLSLGMALLPMLSSCLIDDPPPYTPPGRTPPRLDYHKALPRLDLVIVAASRDTLKFEIPVASEDAGETLTAQFFIDNQFVNYDTIPASTLDDTSRTARFSFLIVGLAGCHRFKIRVAHTFNLPSGDGPANDPNDLAEVYWWANIGLPPGEQGMLAACPNGGATL